MPRIIRVNMQTLEVKHQPVDKSYLRLGGRGLTSWIVSQEVPPTCHPLSEKNKLIIAPGLLSGTGIPLSNKLSIGAKSPMTGGIKESNVGGTTSFNLARLGIKAIILEGKPKDDALYVLHISSDKVSLLQANEYRGCGNYELHQKLRERYGDRVSILSIGQAGEMRLLAASIASSDVKGHPSRHAARGGLGAVMGSKGIKAVITDNATSSRIEIKDKKTLQKLSKDLAQKLVQTKAGLTKYGTAQMVDTANALGGMASYNFHRGSFEQAELINAETLYRNITQRGGEPSVPCMPGCVVRCSNLYRDKNGRYLTSSLEYETIVLMGSNCGISDLDVIASLDYHCDDYGLDTIDTGNVIALMMEAGVLPFGDGGRALKLLQEVEKGSVMGRVVGSGASVVGKILGLDRVPVVKNQGMPAYDPRTFKGMGTTYATSPMGADHTAGPAIPGRGGLDPSKTYDLTDPRGQVELARDLQIIIAVCDAMGWCFFVGPDPNTMHLTAKLLNACYGWQVSFEDVVEMGRRILRWERDFNRSAGFTKAHDRLPAFMLEEKQPPSGRIFDVDQNEIENMFS